MLNDEAFNELLSNAKNGDSTAQNSLAARYATGDGVDKDLEEAVYWYKQASLNDESDAFYNLGLMHLLGEGVDKDDSLARVLLGEAIECGSSDACLVLAEAYENGNLFNLKIDINESAKFYLNAALLGSIKGLKGISILLSEKKLNLDQLSRIIESLG